MVGCLCFAYLFNFMRLSDLLHLQVLKGHIALGNTRFPNGTNGI